MDRFAQDFTDQTLEHASTDAVYLLDAMGAVPEIRAALYSGGMTDEDVIEGRSLLLATLVEPIGAPPAVDDEASRNQRAAVAELDAWDEPNFLRYRAALVRRFPSAAQYVFGDLTAARGAEAVKGIATFLARIDHLENGTDPSRGDSKKDDKKAVVLLEKRGLTPDVRKHLAKLVKVALGPTGAAATSAPAIDPAQRRERQLALKLWYNEWATTARALIRKRAYLIRMGLASRKTHEKAPESTSEPTK